MPKDLFGKDALYSGLRTALGESLEKGIPVTLGYIDFNGAEQLLASSSDGIQKYWFTRSDGLPPGEAHNLGPNPLLPQFLRYGAPIYVSRAATGKREWYIDGLQPGDAADFFGSRVTTAAAPTPTTLDLFVPGLIAPTAPPSMRVQVFGAPYTLNADFKWIGTRVSADLTSSIPATDGQAKYALVQVDFATAALNISYGEEFDAALTHQQAWASDRGTGTLLPQADGDKFRAGYVKLISGMSAIRQAHIWAVQEVYTKTDYASILVACDDVVTYNGEVVTV